MATHDYVIDNASGSAVRTDLNNVLQAVLTNNSSASAPSTTAAYMLWADTSNNILKMRNSADNAWINLFTLFLTDQMMHLNLLIMPKHLLEMVIWKFFTMALILELESLALVI